MRALRPTRIGAPLTSARPWLTSAPLASVTVSLEKVPARYNRHPEAALNPSKMNHTNVLQRKFAAKQHELRVTRGQ